MARSVSCQVGSGKFPKRWVLYDITLKEVRSVPLVDLPTSVWLGRLTSRVRLGMAQSRSAVQPSMACRTQPVPQDEPSRMERRRSVAQSQTAHAQREVQSQVAHAQREARSQVVRAQREVPSQTAHAASGTG